MNPAVPDTENDTVPLFRLVDGRRRVMATGRIAFRELTFATAKLVMVDDSFLSSGQAGDKAILEHNLMVMMSAFAKLIESLKNYGWSLSKLDIENRTGQPIEGVPTLKGAFSDSIRFQQILAELDKESTADTTGARASAPSQVVVVNRQMAATIKATNNVRQAVAGMNVDWSQEPKQVAVLWDLLDRSARQLQQFIAEKNIKQVLGVIRSLAGSGLSMLDKDVRVVEAKKEVINKIGQRVVS